MKRLLTHIILVIVFAFMTNTPVCAQRRLMDDVCKEWYAKAMQDISSPKGLMYADSILNRGQRIGNKDAVIQARCLRALHYSHFKDIGKLHEEAEALRREAKANNDSRSFYYAYSLEIQNRLNNEHTLEALRYAKEMAEAAKNTRSNFGKYTTLRSLGTVYYARKDYKKTIEILDSALQLTERTNKDYLRVRTTDVSIMLADAHKHLRQWASAEACLNEGLSNASNANDSLAILIEHAKMAAEKGDKGSFSPLYASVKKLAGNGGINTQYSQEICTLDAYDFIFNGECKKAERIAATIENKEDRIRLERDIRIKKGDYFGALAFEKELIAALDSTHLKLTNQDMTQLNKQLNNNELKSHAEKQAAELLQMQIMKAQSEHEQTEMRARAMELQDASLRKKAKEDELKAQALINNMKIKRLNHEKEQQMVSENNRRTHFINTMMSMLIFLFVSAIIVVFFWIKRSRSINKKLAELTMELSEARNEALKTNRIKTLFIQNMNHEIRTPLNTVTGFAQVLSSKDIAVSEEERLEYGQHITNNAKVLNMLIDDILNIADIESGKFMVTPRKHNLNGLLKSVIDAVEYQKPNEVEITYSTDAEGDVEFMADARRVQQILTNFVSNALKHTYKGSIWLQCSLNEMPGKLVFSVSDDSGIMSEKIRNEIRDSLNNPDPEATGMQFGLYICKTIADKIDGEVDLDESYKEGTKMRFIMPYVKPTNS